MVVAPKGQVPAIGAPLTRLTLLLPLLPASLGSLRWVISADLLVVVTLRGRETPDTMAQLMTGATLDLY